MGRNVVEQSSGYGSVSKPDLFQIDTSQSHKDEGASGGKMPP